MTTQQLIPIICACSVALVAVVYFTRATSRRVFGALVGGASAGLVALGMIALCEAIGSWRIPLDGFAPGVAPILADAVTYVGIVALGMP